VALPALRKLHITPARQKSDAFEEEDFVALVTDADKADLARYQAAKKSASECYDREWDKRDPDHNASHYDVTTYNKAGKIEKVERMSAKLDREVSAKCKLEVVWKQRDLLEARVLGKYETQRAAWKAESEKHLAEVGFAR
jgi:hypothetical protein